MVQADNVAGAVAVQAAPTKAGSQKQERGGARATVSQQRGQRGKGQIGKARQQTQREDYVAEFDMECGEVERLMEVQHTDRPTTT